jgi:gas vesicle protein
MKVNQGGSMDDDRGLSYFFLGLGIGAAVGILFAPKSGEETRQELLNRAQEGTDYLKRRGEEMREQATEYVERGRSTVARQRDQLKNAVDAGREAYRESLKTPASSSSGEGA